MTATSRPDAVVVGAGIVGAACAWELANAGLKVLVCDSAYPGAGTTSAGMGHVVVMDDSPAQLALTVESRRRWANLAASMPSSCEDQRTGTLWIAASDAEVAGLQEKARVLARAGVPYELLDDKALAEAEPQLKPGLPGACLVPDDRVLYPPGAARWLLDEARGLGVELRCGVQVQAIAAGAVQVESAAGCETISCGSVVLATGVDAPRLVPELAIVPRKGHLVITDRYPELIHHQLVELGYSHSAHRMTGESTAFNLQPRTTGQVLIGSSRELVGRNAAINRDVVGAMLRRAAELVPVLSDCLMLRTWTGFRPATPDSLPLIGAWPAITGLYIAAGHEGLGITTAPATAALIRAAITGETPPLDPTPFDPSRSMPLEAAA